MAAVMAAMPGIETRMTMRAARAGSALIWSMISASMAASCWSICFSRAA
jgi:hypothetical protein